MQYLFGAFQFWPVIIFIPETMSPVSFTRLAKAGSLTLQRTSGATFASVFKKPSRTGEIAGPFLEVSNIARLMRCYGSF